MKIAFCTIATSDYLPLADNLRDSIQNIYGDNCDTYILLIDKARPTLDAGADILYFEDIPNPYRYDMAFRYDLAELACAYKPPLMKFVMEQQQAYDIVVFLDADIELYSRLEELERAIDGGAAILLTPHSIVPRQLGRPIDDRLLILAGPLNSGFVAVARSPRSQEFLNWWEYVLRTQCHLESQRGYFARDQKWITLAPYYFEDVHIIRHPGYNVAHFNVSERLDWLTDGLRFFHFTRLDADVDDYLERHAIDDNPDLRSLLTNYIGRIAAKRERFPTITPHTFDRTATGRTINRMMRKAYRDRYPAAREIPDWPSVDALYTEMLDGGDLTQLPPLYLAIREELAYTGAMAFDLGTHDGRLDCLRWIDQHGAAAFQLSEEMLASARAARPIQKQYAAAAHATCVEQLMECEREVGRLRQHLADVHEQSRKDQLEHDNEIGQLQHVLTQQKMRASSRKWLFRQLLTRITKGKAAAARRAQQG